MTDFDVDAFLAQPLVARVATAGPRVRPVWFLWEDGCFWWITGSYSRLPKLLAEDPRVAVVIDSCDLASGQVRQVIAHGEAEVVALDVDRARRKIGRYLGMDTSRWDSRFTEALEDPDSRLVRLRPDRLGAKDLSYRPSGTAGAPP